MEKEKINQKLAKLIAFVSPKGGTGKSTYTTLLASWLHYVEKKKVVVVDCDTQQSIIDLKTREENFLSRLANEKFKNRIAKEHEVNGEAYPITIVVTRTTHFFPKSAMTIDTNIKYLLEEIFVLLEEGANVWFDKFNF